MARVIIVALWAWAILSAVLNEMPTHPRGAGFPAGALPIVIAMPLIVFGLGALMAKHSPFYAPQLAKWIDARAGENAYEAFLVRLKPLLLFGASALISGALALSRVALAGGPPEAYVIPSFFLSGGVSFVLSHIILRRKGAKGV